MPNTKHLSGEVDRINVDNADKVVYLKFVDAPEKHILRIPGHAPFRPDLNLTKPGDQVTLEVIELYGITNFANLTIDA